MAFVVQDRWVVESHNVAIFGDPSTPNLRSGNALSDRVSRNLLGFCLMALVHALLFLVVVMHLFGLESPIIRNPPGASVLTLIDVGQLDDRGPTAKTPAPATAANKKLAVSAPRPPAVAVMPAEWHSEKIRIMVAAPTRVISAVLVSPPGSGGLGNEVEGGAAAGSSGYDPYAGASPRPFAQSVTQVAGGSTVPAQPRHQASGAWGGFLTRLRARYPHASGTLYLQLRFDLAGRIAWAHVEKRAVQGVTTREIERLLIGEYPQGLAQTPGREIVEVGPIRLDRDS